MFTGVRQDSGDPANFVKMLRDFYNREGIKGEKVVVFSDSLDIEHCLEYKALAEEAGFTPVFGVGTFFTSKLPLILLQSLQDERYSNLFTDDFTNKSDGRKSKPLNIVIKIASAKGRPAVKLSDNMGKNTGDQAQVQAVKKRLGYVEHEWEQGDERNRWARAQ